MDNLYVQSYAAELTSPTTHVKATRLCLDLVKNNCRVLKNLATILKRLKSFVNGWYYTGDKVNCDKEGCFWFVGRDDDVIKSSGYSIGPLKLRAP